MTRKSLRIRKLRRLCTASLLIAAAGSISSNCSIYDESLLVQGAGGGGAGGSAGVGADAGLDGPPPPPCELTRVPPPPRETNLGGGVEPFVVAFSNFDFGDEGGLDGGRHEERLIGFDLDSQCTQQGESACVRPVWATGDVTDGPGGIDNSLQKVIQFVHEQVPRFGSQSYTTAIQDGLTSVVARISDYNGQADDDFIQVDIFVPERMSSFPTAERTKPLWDGEDVWPISSDSVIDGNLDQPRYRSTSGYVSNYTAVANLDLALMKITTGVTETVLAKIEVNFIKPFVVARIEQDAQGRYLLKDGVIAGKWPVQHFISQLGQFVDPQLLARQQVVPLCPPLPYHEIFRDEICELVDTIADPTAPVPECDSLSVGIGFDALPARLGDVYVVGGLPEPCTPENDPSLPEYFCGKPILRTDAGSGGSAGGGGTGGGGTGASGGTGGSGASGGTGGASDASQDTSGGTAGMDASIDSSGDG